MARVRVQEMLAQLMAAACTKEMDAKRTPKELAASSSVTDHEGPQNARLAGACASRGIAPRKAVVRRRTNSKIKATARKNVPKRQEGLAM